MYMRTSPPTSPVASKTGNIPAFQLKQQIQRLMQAKSSQSNHFYLETSPHLRIKGQLQISDQHISVYGFFLRNNGLPVAVKDVWVDYIENFLQQDDSFINYHYQRTQKILNFRIHSKIKVGAQFPFHNLIYISQRLIRSSKRLEEALGMLGIIKKYNRRAINIKQRCLELSKKAVEIIESKSPIALPKIQKNTVESAMKNCLQIKQIPDPPSLSCQKPIIPSDSSPFVIQHKYFSILQQSDQTSNLRELAIKKVNPKLKNQQQHQNKLKRQYEIIQNIKYPEYCLTYYKDISQIQKPQVMYMDYTKDTSYDLIYQRFNSIEDILDFGHQIVSAVLALHQSGIVHRDLKPENILVKYQGKKKYELKIIDFGESCLIDHENNHLQLERLGHTFPYSPLECEQRSIKGLFKKQIDYWSVGVLLYELCFRKNPISYFQPFSQNISKGWKVAGEFNLFANPKIKKGLSNMELIINLIALHSIQICQNERLNLQKNQQLIEACQQFMGKVRMQLK